MRFVDTNILLYAVSTDRREAKKAEAALQLLDEQDLVVSVQVLQEFYVQATRASRDEPLTHDQASLLVEAFMRFPVQGLTVDIMQHAFDTCDRFQISYWDAAIIEAARAAGCNVVLSEDLNDGQDYGGVRVIDPLNG